MAATPASRSSEDPSDHEEDQEEEEQREQEEPGEEVIAVAHHVDDLDLLPVLLGGLHLLQGLGLAGVLARVVRGHPDPDTGQDHEQQRDDRNSSTHLDLLVSRLTPRCGRDVKGS